MSVVVPVEIVLRWDVDQVNEWKRCPVHLLLHGEPVTMMWLPLDTKPGAAVLLLLSYALRRTP